MLLCVVVKILKGKKKFVKKRTMNHSTENAHQFSKQKKYGMENAFWRTYSQLRAIGTYVKTSNEKVAFDMQ